MSKANTQNFFLHGVQFLQQIQQLADPSVVPMRIIAASGDDKPIKEGDLVVVRELPGGHTVDVPPLAFLGQHSHEHPEVPSVHLLHVLRVLRA